MELIKLCSVGKGVEEEAMVCRDGCKEKSGTVRVICSGMGVERVPVGKGRVMLKFTPRQHPLLAVRCGLIQNNILRVSGGLQRHWDYTFIYNISHRLIIFLPLLVLVIFLTERSLLFLYTWWYGLF